MLESSILALSHMCALPKPDKRYDTMHHVYTVKDVLIRIGRRLGELQPPPLVMACFVMRVPVSGVGVAGVSVSLGLAEWTGKPVDPAVETDALGVSPAAAARVGSADRTVESDKDLRAGLFELTRVSRVICFARKYGPAERVNGFL
jgi:hypothetical protein